MNLQSAVLTLDYRVCVAFDTTRPGHRSTDPVPFRLTPNMQHFITPAGIEGLLTSGVTAMARSLSNPEFDLESSLSLFLRDEVRVTPFVLSISPR